jgi:hypothetical protein
MGEADKIVCRSYSISAINPDAKITKMKDGRTHFAEKCEQAMDFSYMLLSSLTETGTQSTAPIVTVPAN